MTDNNGVSQVVSITVNGTNDAPVLHLHNGGEVWTVPQTPVDLAPSLTLTDVDSSTLDHAAIQITGGYDQNNDILSFTDTNEIQGSLGFSYRHLTLTGIGDHRPTIGEFQAALASVTFDSTSTSTADRTVTFTVQDPNGTANGGSDTSVGTATVRIASSIYWTAADGTWDTSENWNPAQTPTASNNVFIGVDQNGVPVVDAVVDATAVSIDVHSLNLSSGAELDANDITVGGDLTVFDDPNASGASQATDIYPSAPDLMIHGVGGNFVVFSDNSGDAEVIADGNLTVDSGDPAVNAISDNLTVSAVNGSYAELYAGGDLTIGSGLPAGMAIGGNLAVTAYNGSQAYLDFCGR